MKQKLLLISSLYFTHSHGSQMSELTPPSTDESQDTSYWMQRTSSDSGASSEPFSGEGGLSPKLAHPHFYAITKGGGVIKVPSSKLAANAAAREEEKPVGAANENLPPAPIK